MQCGEITVPDKDLGIPADRAVVQQRKDAERSVSSAYSDDGSDMAVGEEAVHILRAFSVMPREIPVAFVEVASCLYAIPLPLEVPDAPFQHRSIVRCACRCTDADDISTLQVVRFQYLHMRTAR